MSYQAQLLKKTVLSALKQNSTLSIHSRVRQTNLRIIPHWEDHGSISVENNEIVKLKISQEDEEKMTSLGRLEPHIRVEIEPNDNKSEANPSTSISPLIEVQVPEKVNLLCHLEEGGDIHVKNKIEGDADLTTTRGNILVKKLRSYNMSLKAAGNIFASDLLEARNVNLRATHRVRVKRIHGREVDIEIGNQLFEENSEELLDGAGKTYDDDDDGAMIDISSLYVTGNGFANLNADSPSSPDVKAIRCKSNHGHVNANANGQVELGGVNGSFDVLSHSEAHIHIDSLSNDSISVVTGDKLLSLTMDRKLESDIRLASINDAHDVARSVLLEEEDDDVHEGLKDNATPGGQPISIITTCFKPDEIPESLDEIYYAQGHVDNESMEPDSRFEQLKGGGKIRLDGAATQALSGFSETNIGRPLIVGACKQRIVVESMSWLGAIARRYGLQEEEGRDRLGRQATRRGREFNVSGSPNQ